jgi:hypothetical protein
LVAVRFVAVRLVAVRFVAVRFVAVRFAAVRGAARLAEDLFAFLAAISCHLPRKGRA